MEDEEVELTDLEGKMYAWIIDMVPSHQAIELARQTALEARQHGKTWTVIGFIIGVVVTLGSLRWLA